MAEAIIVKKLTSFALGSIPRLTRVVHFLQRVLTFSPADDFIFPQKSLSVSIGKGDLSVAYGTRFLSGIMVKGAKTYPLEDSGRYPQPEEIVSSLALAVNEFGVPKTDITLSIPKAWTIIRTVEFPSTVKENLASVIAYEMDRITPFTSEEAFFDFRMLKEDDGRITLLVMAARVDAVMPYMTALEANGFAVSRITVDLAGIGALCAKDEKNSDIFFIGIDEKGYEGAHFARGSMVQVFSGSFTTTDEGPRAEAISASLKNLIEASKGRGNSPKVIAHLKGGNPSLVELLKVRMGVPFAILRLTDARIKFARPYQELPYGAVGSMVESLQPVNKGLNLLKRGIYAKQKPPLAFTIILTCVIIVLWAVYLIAPLRVEKERLAEITHAIASKKAEVKKVEDLKKEANELTAEISSIRSFKEDRPLVLNILKELTVVLPKTTWLTRVRVTETGVDIEGYAASASELLPRLEASKYFQKVEFASPTFRDVRMNSDRFVIKTEIEGVKKSTETAPKADGGTKKAPGEKPKHDKK